jgi:pheromone a factor receptor
MGLTLTQMLWATFVTIANMWFTVSPGLRPWVSWAYVHSGFSRMGVFPRLFIPQAQ